MSFWTTLRDDLIPFQWFKHGGNKKDWLRRAAEFPLAMMGAQALPGIGGGIQSLLGQTGGTAFPAGTALDSAEMVTAPQGLLGKIGNMGGGMSQKQLMMAQMAMNMAKPGEPPPIPQAQPMGQGGPIPPAPSLISPTPPAGAGVAAGISGSMPPDALPGETMAEYKKRKMLQSGIIGGQNG
jgi:hypothetical protein